VQLAVLRTAVWLPLLLWALLRATAQPGRWGWWIAAGVATAVMWMAGHPQTFLFAGYAAGAWLILLLVLAWRRTRRWLALLAGAALAGVVALGLAAAQLLPSLEYVGLSVRADTSYAFVSGGFPLQDTWQLILPGVLTFYSPLYVGVAALGLAVVAIFGQRAAASAQDSATSAPGRGGVWFFCGVTLFALLASYGDNGPLYPLLYQIAPGWNLFRGQERAAYLVAFGLSVLAGYGAALAPILRQRTRARIATMYAGAIIGGVYAFGLLWQLPGRTTMGQWRYLLLAAATIALATGFAMLLRWPGWSDRRSALLAALVIGNLFVVNIGTNLGDFDPVRKTLPPPEVAALQVAAAETATANLGVPGRVYNEFRVYEDYAMRAEVEDVWGASPLRLARYAALFDAFPLDRMWRLTGVDHVLTWRRELFMPSTLLAEFPQAADTTYLHRLAEPNPRAWLVGRGAHGRRRHGSAVAGGPHLRPGAGRAAARRGECGGRRRSEHRRGDADAARARPCARCGGERCGRSAARGGELDAGVAGDTGNLRRRGLSCGRLARGEPALPGAGARRPHAGGRAGACGRGDVRPGLPPRQCAQWVVDLRRHAGAAAGGGGVDTRKPFEKPPTLTQRRGDAVARREAAKPPASALSLDFLCVSLDLRASASNQVTLQTGS
jgi:hypothetical protein